MTTVEKKLIFNTLSVLNDIVGRKGAEAEQLEVAIDCLSNYFRIDLSNEASRRQLLIPEFLSKFDAAFPTVEVKEESDPAAEAESKFVCFTWVLNRTYVLGHHTLNRARTVGKVL